MNTINLFFLLLHNGNSTNAKELKSRIGSGRCGFKATGFPSGFCDSKTHLGLRGAIKATMERIEGAYSIVGLTRNKFLLFRDFHGIRPLV